MTFRKTLSYTAALVLASALAYAQAPAPAPAAAPAPQGPPPQPQLGPNEWNIDTAHTTAGFTVKHLMVSTVPGSLGKVTGKVTFDPKNPSSLAVEASIDASTIDTNNDRRDAHLKSPDFFEVAKYPTITFKSKKVTPGANGTAKLVGDLTMHGVTKEVALDVTDLGQPIANGRNLVVGAAATTTIKRSEWGLTWNRALEAGGVTVSDEVKITLGIEANRPNPNAPPPQQQPSRQ